VLIAIFSKTALQAHFSPKVNIGLYHLFAHVSSKKALCSLKKRPRHRVVQAFMPAVKKQNGSIFLAPQARAQRKAGAR
jgi:hypothetical protein